MHQSRMSRLLLALAYLGLIGSVAPLRSNAQSEDQERFLVYHPHKFSSCDGYMFISAKGFRYEGKDTFEGDISQITKVKDVDIGGNWHKVVRIWWNDHAEDFGLEDDRGKPIDPARLRASIAHYWHLTGQSFVIFRFW